MTKTKEQKILHEALMFYNATDKRPNTMRFSIRMTDEIDPDLLQAAAQKCMKRYPYFTVELVYKDGEYTLVYNSRPIVVSPEWDRMVLGSEMTNYHLAAFSYHKKWLNIDITHALTDGTGVYNIARTLLYYYCTAKYDADISGEGIMLAGDEIPDEEWVHPALKFNDIQPRIPAQMPRALSLFRMSGGDAPDCPDALNHHNAPDHIDAPDHHDTPDQHMVYRISTDEKDFIDFVKEIEGTPGTVVAALMDKAVASCHPDSEEAIRIILSVNMRKALGAPLAHHPLVGGVMLECGSKAGPLSLKEQVRMYRSAVAEQTKEDIVIAEAAGQNYFAQHLMSKKTNEERIVLATEHAIRTDGAITAGVSYTGKTDLGQIEQYIEVFRNLTNSIYMTPLLELSAVSGRFAIDFIQPFEDERYIKAFSKELDKCGIEYSMCPGEKMILPKIKLPWNTEA